MENFVKTSHRTPIMLDVTPDETNEEIDSNIRGPTVHHNDGAYKMFDRVLKEGEGVKRTGENDGSTADEINKLNGEGANKMKKQNNTKNAHKSEENQSTDTNQDRRRNRWSGIGAQ